MRPLYLMSNCYSSLPLINLNEVECSMGHFERFTRRTLACVFSTQSKITPYCRARQAHPATHVRRKVLQALTPFIVKLSRLADESGSGDLVRILGIPVIRLSSSRPFLGLGR